MPRKDQGRPRKVEAESASTELNQPALTYDWRSTLGGHYREMLDRSRGQNAHSRHTAHDVASIALQLSGHNLSKRPIIEYLQDATDLLDVASYFLATKTLKAQLGGFGREEKMYFFDEILNNPSLTWESERGLFKAIERTFGRERLKAIKVRRAISENELAEILKDLKRRNQERTSPAREAKK